MDNFFYNLNDKLNAIRATPETKPGQLNERDMSRAAKGYDKKDVAEDFGTTAAIAGGAALGSALGAVKGRYDDMKHRERGATYYTPKDQIDKPRTTMQRARAAAGFPSKNDPNVQKADEGLGDMARKVGGAVKRVAGKALDTLGHGSDEDLRKKMQRDIGATGAQVHGKKPMAQPKEGAAPMSAKQKSFADKIAGAKKEVDEMLGDVAAEAMKAALSPKQKKIASLAGNPNKIDAKDLAMLRKGRNAEVDEEVKSRKIAGSRYGGAKQLDKPEHDDAPKGKAKAGRPESDQLKADWSAFGGNKPVKLAKHKGAVTKHEIGDKTPAKGQAADAAFKASEKASKKVKEGAESDDLDVLERLMHEAFDEGNNALGNAIQGVLEMLDDDEQVNEKAVSKKQQKFMGMVHATQKGEKAPSKAVAKVAKEMPKKAAKDFAATKHKGLPEKKKKEVEETTVSGSVAASAAPAKSKGGMKFGGGIYDSFNRDVEAMISEGMSINMSMNSDGQAGAAKSLTVTATDEDAEQLAQMLSNAGMGSAHAGEPDMHSGDQSCQSCGMSDCGCGDIEEALDENNPDWPTEPTGQEDNINYYDTDGLNGRKSTGQTTVPVIASQEERQMAYEDQELARMMEMAGMTQNEGYYDLNDEGMQPIDLSANPSFKQLVNRYTQLFYQGHEGDYSDEESKESDAIEQYVAKRFGEKGSEHLMRAANASYGGRDDGRGMGGSRSSNLGRSSQPGGDFRTTKAGKMHGQDVKAMKSKVADRLGRHPEPNLPEQIYAEAEDALHRMMEMAGVKKKEVDEEKTDEGNLLTKGLADDDIKIGQKIPGTNVIKKKDIDESADSNTKNEVSTMEQDLMRQFSNFKI